MITAVEMLNKICWDSTYSAGAVFSFGIFDRMKNEITEMGVDDDLTFSITLDKQKFFMNVVVDGVEVQVPVHRMRYIKRNGEKVWSRGAT